MSYVCAYSSVQLDQSCVEKEFTKHASLTYTTTQATWPLSGLLLMRLRYHFSELLSQIETCCNASIYAVPEKLNMTIFRKMDADTANMIRKTYLGECYCTDLSTCFVSAYVHTECLLYADEFHVISPSQCVTPLDSFVSPTITR